jgi:serine/threonine protein kinase/tetratricopeptide (TPR) repeat protein
MAGIEPKLRDLFSRALQCQTPEEQAAYLEQACQGDAELRARLDELLQAHREIGSFLQEPSASQGATVDEPPISERPGTVIGPYKLLQVIGEGGMGVVWMAEQTEPVQRKVALKVIKPGMDSRQVIARFEAERQALALMDHVNIARIFDAGTTASGRPYFVMELVHGVPITRYCDDNHLTPRERLELFVPVCQAIQHAHQKGIIHRDIKPSNVMITLYDGRPVPKVIDFGVAKATEQKLTERTLFTQYGTMVGTLEYMSPEQAEMSALGVDTRSDIYSLGVLLYELLTGSTPLSRKRVKEAAYAEILRMIKEEEPPRPSTRLSDSGETLASISAQRKTEPAKLTRLVRGELDWIVMKSLEKDRNRRYDSVNGLAADVQRYLADEPVQACPPSGWYRFRKFARRNKRALVTATVIGVALLLAVGSLGWLLRDRAARQREAEGRVLETLHVAEPLLREGRPWDPALIAASQRVEAELDGGGLGPGVRRRAEQLRRDVRMLVELDQIRLRQAESGGRDLFDTAGSDGRYRDAYSAYGIDIGALQPSESAARMRDSAIREALIAGLGGWMQVAPAQARERLRDVADGADDNAWRRTFRGAALAGDAQRFKALAGQPEALDQPPGVLAWLGSVLEGAGAATEAVALLRQAQARHPDDFWINYNLGHVLIFSPRPHPSAEAAGYFRAAVAIRPRSAEARSILGLALEDQGKADAAIAAYRQAIALDPKFAIGHSNLGRVLMAKGDYNAAVAEYRKVVELDPAVALAFSNLGASLGRLGKLDEAVAEFRKAVERDPKSAAAHGNLAIALHDQGKLDEAAVEFKEAARLKPDDVVYCAVLAAFLATAKDPKLRDGAEALRLARMTVERAPTNVWSWQALGWALYATESWKESIDAFHKSMDLPQDPKGGDSGQWFGLAAAHARLGEKEEARRWYDRAVQWMEKHMPDHVELRRFRAEAEQALLKE